VSLTQEQKLTLELTHFLPRSEATKQSIVLKDGLLRFARNDDAVIA
jgi:hypothetical protein